jgi:hypothetical protein
MDISENTKEPLTRNSSAGIPIMYWHHPRYLNHFRSSGQTWYIIVYIPHTGGGRWLLLKIPRNLWPSILRQVIPLCIDITRIIWTTSGPVVRLNRYFYISCIPQGRRWILVKIPRKLWPSILRQVFPSCIDITRIIWTTSSPMLRLGR